MRVYRPPQKKEQKGKSWLPLIGTDYNFYDRKIGVAFTGKKDLNIPSQTPEGPRVNGGKWFRNYQAEINWYTDPATRKRQYEYQRIYPGDYDKVLNSTDIQRASYIPYIVMNGERFWLLGSFHDFPHIKTDFGGTCEKKYRETTYECANRELAEETRGVLLEPLKQTFEEEGGIVYLGQTKKESVLFILVDITNHISRIEDMPLLRYKIDIAPPIGTEKYGPLGLYTERALVAGDILTAYNLTDFLTYLRNRFNRLISRSLL